MTTSRSLQPSLHLFGWPCCRGGDAHSFYRVALSIKSVLVCAGLTLGPTWVHVEKPTAHRSGRVVRSSGRCIVSGLVRSGVAPRPRRLRVLPTIGVELHPAIRREVLVRRSIPVPHHVPNASRAAITTKCKWGMCLIMQIVNGLGRECQCIECT